MDLKAKYLSDTCSDPIDFLYQLRQTTESIGGGTEYREDGELVEYDVAIEAIKKANGVFVEKACSWLKNHYRDYMYNPTGERLKAFFGGNMCNDFEDYMKGEIWRMICLIG